MTDEPRILIREAVAAIVSGEGGQMVTRPMFGDRPDLGTFREPEPLPAVRAARRLRDEAAAAVKSHVRRAREDGHSWAAIGEACGFVTDPDRGVPAESQAFTAVTPQPDGWVVRAATFTWICPACRETVHDYGPEAAHPADAEEGHGDGCTRLAEAVRAYDAKWAEES